MGGKNEGPARLHRREGSPKLARELRLATQLDSRGETVFRIAHAFRDRALVQDSSLCGRGLGLHDHPPIGADQCQPGAGGTPQALKGSPVAVLPTLAVQLTESGRALPANSRFRVFM